MKAIKFKFKNGLVWYPIQTLVATIVATIIVITPMLFKKSIKTINNYIENNYIVDDKGTPSVYDDEFVRIKK